METLWPEQTLAQAQDSLRHSLSRLRRALEPDRRAYAPSDFIGTDRNGVWLRVEPGAGMDRHIWIDCLHFEELASAALRTLGPGGLPSDGSQHDDARGAIDRALSLYQGPFLAADRHVEWTQDRRLHYHSQWTTLIQRRVGLAFQDNALDDATLLVSQLVRADPEDEDAAARLMCLQAALGHRAEALRTYERLSAQLQLTLGTRPTREVQELAAAIRMSDSQQDLRLLLLRRFSAA
jgi:DNA-binding SARP family transcriptional activator